MKLDTDLIQKEGLLYVSMLLIGSGATELSARNYPIALVLLALGVGTVAFRGWLKTKGIIKKK